MCILLLTLDDALRAFLIGISLEEIAAAAMQSNRHMPTHRHSEFPLIVGTINGAEDGSMIDSAVVHTLRTIFREIKSSSWTSKALYSFWRSVPTASTSVDSHIRIGKHHNSPDPSGKRGCSTLCRVVAKAAARRPKMLVGRIVAEG
jgi:hypothetical protein